MACIARTTRTPRGAGASPSRPPVKGPAPVLLALVVLALAGCQSSPETSSGAARAKAGYASARPAASRIDGPPNIVLITVESLRTDHVGAYGGKSRSRPEVPLTPVLDALAAEGVVYEQANSVTSWTLASHASLFTGLYPMAHQTRHASDRLDESYETLAERLAAHGYDTAGVISGPYLRKPHNLHQGFAHYHDEISTASNVESHGDTTNPRMLAALTNVLDHELDPSRPFFLFAYFWDPHYDYLPPEPWNAMFQDGGCEPIEVRDFETTETVHPGIRPGQLAYVFSQYAGEIRWTDKHLGALFQHLRDRGLWDNTVIMLTADHGEEFFDHGEKGHYHNLHAESVHVPLIVKYASGGPRGRDARVVSLVDVVPTALELAGAPVTGPVDGRSLLEPSPPQDRSIFFELLSIWRAPPPEPHQAAPVKSASGFDALWQWLVPGAPRGPIPVSIRTWLGIREGNYKLLVSPELGRRELYDVAADPVERHDIARTETDRTQRLQSKLAAHQTEARQTAALFRQSREAALTQEDRDHLRSLGYLQ